MTRVKSSEVGMLGAALVSRRGVDTRLALAPPGDFPDLRLVAPAFSSPCRVTLRPATVLVRRARRAEMIVLFAMTHSYLRKRKPYCENLLRLEINACRDRQSHRSRSEIPNSALMPMEHSCCERSGARRVILPRNHRGSRAASRPGSPWRARDARRA